MKMEVKKTITIELNGATVELSEVEARELMMRLKSALSDEQSLPMYQPLYPIPYLPPYRPNEYYDHHPIITTC